MNKETVEPRRGKREIRRQTVEANLIAAGMELFCKSGFDAVTANDIADSVGISRRTFFRYFKAKDDLVFHWLDERGEFISAKLANLAESEHPIAAMQRAYLAQVDELDHTNKHMLVEMQLILSEPSLRRRYYEENMKWESRWVEIVRRDQRLNEKDLLVLQVHIATTTMAFVRAFMAWALRERRSPLRPWVELAFAAQTHVDGIKNRIYPAN